ncbi:MAG: NPCBM/NEW2 domain-containing protein, partial [Rikenellaceae bacterium]
MKKILLSLLLFASVSTLSAQQKSDWQQQMLTAKENMLKDVPASLPYISKQFNKNDQPGSVDLDVTGLGELVLSVWATGDGNDYDQAVWADAVLVDKNGKEYRLQDEKFKIRNVDGGWFRLGTGFSGKPFAIGKKVYKHGVLAHANSLLVTDLAGRDIVRFRSDMGIDNNSGSNLGSVVFKVLPTSGVEEAKTLVGAVPEAAEVFSLFGISGSDWMTSPSMVAEKSAIDNIANTLDSRKFVDEEFARIEKLSTEKEQLTAYIALVKEVSRIKSAQDQIQWMNVRAIKEAFADFSTTQGYDKAKYQAKMDEFLALTKDGFGDVYQIGGEGIERAMKALELSKEILFSNPALDFDKILVTRYGLGNSARSAGAQSLGTPYANYTSLMQTRRSGYDTEIIELSNIRGEQLQKRSLFKPENGGLIAEVDLHWDGDRMLFTGVDYQDKLQLYELPIEGGEPTLMTRLTEDTDVQFFDAAYLPSGKIVTASNIAYNGVPCVSGTDHVSTYSLYDPQTNQLRRLTFDQDCNWSATVLQNGKVMFTRWEYTDLMHYYSRIVMTMNPDGTEQKGYVGSGAMFPNSTFDMQQLPQNTNRFVGIISGHHGITRSGRMIIFDPTKARKGVEGMVQEILYSNQPINDVAKDYLVDGVWPQFISPQPIT